MQIRPKAWRRAGELLSASVILLTSLSKDSLLSLSLALCSTPRLSMSFYCVNVSFMYSLYLYRRTYKDLHWRPFLFSMVFPRFIHSVVYCSTVHLQHQLAFSLNTLFRQGLRCCMPPVYRRIIYLRHGIYGAGIHLFGLSCHSGVESTCPSTSSFSILGIVWCQNFGQSGPSPQEAEAEAGWSQFEASIGYKRGARTVRAT